ncbi:MAG: rhomboid family intramembrane serine protease [Bacteroidetes bacterium]|nr:MAG: rhomboid family intramembrane serine protease [Bacteroidota bacterium]
MQQFRPGGFTLLPPVVKNLLIINGLFFLATIALGNAFGIDLYRVLGLRFPGAQDFAPYQFITYMFMHGDFYHLFFNMFALWMFGNVLENVWGPKRFVVYYFVTGLGAALLHYAILYWQLFPTFMAVNSLLENPDHESLRAFFESDLFRVVSLDNYRLFLRDYNSLINSSPNEAMVTAVNFLNQYRVDLLNAPVVVGASGAVFGILLAFGLLFPNSLIYLFFAIPIKAKYFVMIYGGLELYFGISRPGSNIAHFAHLGGMLFGFLLIRYWRKKGTLY